MGGVVAGITVRSSLKSMVRLSAEMREAGASSGLLTPTDPDIQTPS